MPTGGSNKTSKEKAKEIVERLDYEFLNNYIENQRTKVIIKDFNGYIYDCFLGNLVNGHPPRFVSKSNPLFSLKNITIWLKLHNKNFELYENNVYENSEKKLMFHCLKCDEIFEMAWLKVYSDQNCSFCRGLRVGKYNNLAYLRPELVEEWSSENKISPFDVVEFSHIKIWWICKKCKYKWQAFVQTRTKGEGCPACCGKVVTDKNRLSILFPEIAIQWHPYKNKDFLPTMFSFASSKEKIWWLCNKCGYEWKNYISQRTSNGGRGCPKCRSSKGNKIIENFLIKNDINFIPEYKFEDCKNIFLLPFDFYLPDYNILIEYDGIVHYEDKFNNLIEFEKVKMRDDIKTKYCIDKDILLIRVPYWELDNIENILYDKLNLL